jgi:hypothetical protein
MECGGNETELNHYQEHQYNEYELYFQQRLVLCGFCAVDFSSFDPTFFGFEKGKRLGLQDFSFVREVRNKELRLDKFCPSCNYRLPFLNFMLKCRKENNGNGHVY